MNEAVIDTNVLVSGLLSPHNPPGRIVDAIRSGDLRLAVDDRILSEYRTVLRRPYFEQFITPAEREWIIEFLNHETRSVVSNTNLPDLPDPKDTCFLEVAYTTRLVLVTGNVKHFPKRRCRGVIVISPRIFYQSMIG